MKKKEPKPRVRIVLEVGNKPTGIGWEEYLKQLRYYINKFVPDIYKIISIYYD